MKKITIIIAIITVAISCNNLTNAQSSQSNYAGAAISTGTGKTWTVVSGALTPDLYCAMVTLDKSTNTNYYSKGLKLTNFSFSIPSMATIQGVKVTISREALEDNVVKDKSFQLVCGGTTSVNKKKTAFYLADVWETVTYGSSTDMWGMTLTPAQINSNVFGCVFKCENFDNNDEHGVAVDYCSITVYYVSGHKLYSQSINAVSNKLSINIFPNPASELINLDFVSEKTGSTKIDIANSAGQIVKSISENMCESILKKQIDITELPPGNYVLKVSNAEGTNSKKFIKQ